MNILLQENILIIITLFGILQGIVLALVVFFYPERDKNSNALLAIFILSAAIILMAPILQQVLGWKYVWIFHCIKFITIASLYLYIRSLSEFIRPARTAKHFSFALAYVPIALHYVFYILDKYNVEYTYNGGEDPYDIVIALSNLAYIGFYVVLYFRAYHQHKANVLANFSSLKKLGLVWIRQLIIGFLAIIGFSYAMFGYILAEPEFSTTACLLNMAVISAFLYFVTIRGKISPEIYKLRTLLANQHTDTAPLQPGTFKAATPANQYDGTILEELAKKVKAVMEKDQFYRNDSASIKELGEAINAQPYLVSQAINTVLGKTFFELVNTYRVEHAKRMLTDNAFDKFSLVGIGFESGFNSKTTFNTTFKKVTGQTPSEFKRTALPQSNTV